ncbi:nucleotide exchange factor GrpE, partial [Candidatus Gracilibacteria bacterium]|nr:nucleotide exchange factor GrpE [Candidatus Gracilibacteria bacterium]
LEEAQSEPDLKEKSALEMLAKVQADFDNFKKRTTRDKDEMIFFLKSNVVKKILPRADDVERMLKNTPEDMQSGALYEGIVALDKSLKKDLTGIGAEKFVSIGEQAHPDKHDIMTQIPGSPENEIIEEFEAGYMLEGKVLRHAKVVVGAGV